jgi:predicted phosphoribosyltransferase
MTRFRDREDAGRRIAAELKAFAAVRSIRAEGPKKIVLAAPVASPGTGRAMEAEVDRVVVLHQPADLLAIGLWYDDFTQVSDDAVLRLLDRARHEQARAAPAGA